MQLASVARSKRGTYRFFVIVENSWDEAPPSLSPFPHYDDNDPLVTITTTSLGPGIMVTTPSPHPLYFPW